MLGWESRSDERGGSRPWTDWEASVTATVVGVLLRDLAAIVAGYAASSIVWAPELSWPPRARFQLSDVVLVSADYTVATVRSESWKTAESHGQLHDDAITVRAAAPLSEWPARWLVQADCTVHGRLRPWWYIGTPGGWKPGGYLEYGTQIKFEIVTRGNGDDEVLYLQQDEGMYDRDESRQRRRQAGACGHWLKDQG